MVPGPFFGWYWGFSPSEIQATHALLAETLEEDDPFDAIFGFSQGATLALCYLLQHQITNPEQSPPAHFAVLFSCAGPAFSSDMQLNQDIIRGLAPEDFDELWRRLAPRSTSSRSEEPCGVDVGQAQSQQQKEAFLATLSSALRLGNENGFIEDPETAIAQWRAASLRGREDAMTRIFHPALTCARLKIPVVMVVGDNDTAEVFEQVTICRELCDPALVELVGHSAAHDVPKKPEEVQKITVAIRAAEADARLMFSAPNMSC
ncbi:hypothetical protein BDW66DRAFT_155759 [Aspergillus desertorum]